MTRAEWNAKMQRYMHRADLSADLDEVFERAVETFKGRWLRSWTYLDDAELLAAQPRAMSHAGLMYLHELAQDDAGLSREVQLFDAAMRDAAMRYSIDNVTPDPLATGGINAP